MNSEDLAEVFSIFHDGQIDSWSEESDCLRLKISCQYIAQKIDPAFDDFYLDLIGITHLEFSPWTDDPEDIVWTDRKAILDTSPGILDGRVADGYTEIICDRHWNDEYAGGIIQLACSNFRLYDQEMNTVSLEELIIAAKSYWSQSGNLKQ